MLEFHLVVRRVPAALFNLPTILALSIAILLTGCSGSAGSASGGSSTTLTPPSQAAGYHAAFDEEFNSLSLSNTGKGAAYTWYNPGIWWETPAPSTSITASPGVLSLVWNQGQTPAYDTSIATSADNASNYKAWTYGYFEIKMKFNPTTGSWPALWLIPTAEITDSSGEHGEIDIFEWQSNTPATFYGTIHDWVGSTDIENNNSRNAHPLPAGTKLADYHTYGMLWTPSTISWYFDNTLMGSSTAYAIFGTQSYYLILGQQVGTHLTHTTSAMTTPTLTMNVEWVHVFQP